MNKLYFIATLFLSTIIITSCDKDEKEPEVIDYAYHAHIHSPNSDNKHVSDSIHLHIEFESHTGEPVHHVNIRIYNKADGTEVYNKPDVAHVHAAEGVYEYHDDFVLSSANGVSAHTDWVLEAKVWGENDGDGEEIETVEFHVHPE